MLCAIGMTAHGAWELVCASARRMDGGVCRGGWRARSIRATSWWRRRSSLRACCPSWSLKRPSRCSPPSSSRSAASLRCHKHSSSRFISCYPQEQPGSGSGEESIQLLGGFLFAGKTGAWKGSCGQICPGDELGSPAVSAGEDGGGCVRADGAAGGRVRERDGAGVAGGRGAARLRAGRPTGGVRGQHAQVRPRGGGLIVRPADAHASSPGAMPACKGASSTVLLQRACP